jgi:hypothetical protein
LCLPVPSLIPSVSTLSRAFCISPELSHFPWEIRFYAFEAPSAYSDRHTC